MPDEPQPPALDDRRRPRDENRIPSRALAIALLSPGAFCWCSFLIFIQLMRLDPPLHGVPGTPRHSEIQNFSLRAFLVSWLPAILCAIASILIYVFWPRPRRYPWHVILNLAINVAGLAFTLLVVGAFIFGYIFNLA